MTTDDLRLTAQLVAAGRVHCVSDEAVEALARRVLELERWAALAAQEAIDVEAVEREACAKLVESKAHAWRSAREVHQSAFEYLASQIRARGAR